MVTVGRSMLVLNVIEKVSLASSAISSAMNSRLMFTMVGWFGRNISGADTKLRSLESERMGRRENWSLYFNYCCSEIGTIHV